MIISIYSFSSHVREFALRIALPHRTHLSFSLLRVARIFKQVDGVPCIDCRKRKLIILGLFCHFVSRKVRSELILKFLNKFQDSLYRILKYRGLACCLCVGIEYRMLVHTGFLAFLFLF